MRKHCVIKFDKDHGIFFQDLAAALIVAPPLFTTRAAANSLAPIHERHRLGMLALAVFDYEIVLTVVGINRQPPASPVFTAITD
ncbi:MAG: hypothetical protein ABSE82_15660 [Nitrososphaerales archaeon]